jgi:hypothetical protein
MRHFKIAGVLAVAALAVSAAPALAHEFISTGGVTKGKGEEQVFRLGPFKIECAKASTSKGSMTAGSSQTLFASMKPQKCATEAKIGGNPIFLHTRFLTPLAIEYHANGFVEIGSEGEEIEGNATLKGGSVEMKISTIKCILTLPEQTLPHAAEKKPENEFEAATYSNEEEEKGKRKFDKLSIFNEFKGIHFEYGEGQCADFNASEEERHSGRYEGELIEEVRGGSLEFQ